MSFAQCVVVPMDVYRRKCQNKGTSESILAQNLPSDLKMKLFDQEKQLAALRKNNNDSVSWVLNQFTLTEKPIVQKILENFIEKNRHVISYHPASLEIISDGTQMPNSNFVKSLQWLLGAGVNPSIEPPPGALQLKEKLISLGVPITWLRSEKTPVTSEAKFFTDQHPELSLYRPRPDSVSPTESRELPTQTPISTTTPSMNLTTSRAAIPTEVQAEITETPIKKSAIGKPLAQSTPTESSPEITPVKKGADVKRKSRPESSLTDEAVVDTPEATPGTRRHWHGKARGKKLDYSHKYPGDDWVTGKPGRSKGKDQTGAGYWVF